MSERKPLSKKTRFEIFKRDKFQCQYCGQKAPDVVLECDHIRPVSKGGEDDILNLVTSCKACNSGKSDRELSDNALLDRQRAQLADLEERRQQLDWMLQWRDELAGFDDTVLEKVSDYWASKVHGYVINATGEAKLRKWLARYSFERVLQGIDDSCGSYLRFDGTEAVTAESVEKVFQMIPRVIENKDRLEKQPWLRDLYYARGILRNRLNYCDDHAALQLMKQAFDAGAEVEEIKDVARTVRNWSAFRRAMEDIIHSLGGANGQD